MSDSIMSRESTFLDAKSYIDVKTVHFKEFIDLNSKTFRSKKEASIAKENAKRLKELLSSAAVNFLQHFLKKRRMYIKDSHQSEPDK